MAWDFIPVWRNNKTAGLLNNGCRRITKQCKCDLKLLTEIEQAQYLTLKILSRFNLRC